MNRNSLKTPTGRRQTSWLFTKRAGVEFGATEDKSIQWQGGGLEPGTSGLQVQHPNHKATPNDILDILPTLKHCWDLSTIKALIFTQCKVDIT